MNKIFKQIKSSTNIQILILFAISVLFVLLFSTTTSPLYLSNPYWYIGDSGIFQEMGLVIAHGGTPYVDVFDHKGPVLFFIQALGLLINEHWGIFVLQAISLSLTLWIWYKMISLFQKNIWIEFGTIILALLFLFGYCERGNLCEEWSLPYISIPIYLFLKHWPEGMRLSGKEWFLVGLCTCIVIFIRANNIAPILGFALYSISLELIKKDKMVLRHLLMGLLGCVLVAGFWIIFFLFYYGKEALSWMLYGTFLFNFDYIQGGRSVGTWYDVLYYVSILCFVLLTIFTERKNSGYPILPILISYAITAFAIGSNKFIHYLIIFIPLFVVSLVSLTKIRWQYVLLFGVAILQALYMGESEADVVLVRLLKDTPVRASMNDFNRFLANLSEEEKSDIYNYYALPTQYFSEEKIVHRNRCVMSSHIQYSSRLQGIEQIEGLISKSPTWVLTPDDYSQIDSVDFAFICDHYAKMDSIIGYDENGFVYCYKRMNECEIN